MLMIQKITRMSFDKPSSDSLPFLEKKIKEHEQGKKLYSILKKALLGKYERAYQMREELIELSFHKQESTLFTQKKKAVVKRKRSEIRKQKRMTVFVDFFLVVTFIIFLYILYLFGQTM